MTFFSRSVGRILVTFLFVRYRRFSVIKSHNDVNCALVSTRTRVLCINCVCKARLGYEESIIKSSKFDRSIAASAVDFLCACAVIRGALRLARRGKVPRAFVNARVIVIHLMGSYTKFENIFRKLCASYYAKERASNRAHRAAQARIAAKEKYHCRIVYIIFRPSFVLPARIR